MGVAGDIQVLTVHGRTRHQKQQMTGTADWQIIAKIKASLRIPVIANGGVETYDDAQAALTITGADAVMSAEGVCTTCVRLCVEHVFFLSYVFVCGH